MSPIPMFSLNVPLDYTKIALPECHTSIIDTDITATTVLLVLMGYQKKEIRFYHYLISRSNTTLD